jgi:preprotein translocase subunit SecB
MSDEMTGPNSGSQNGTAQDNGVKIQIIGQYVKDLSFENPGAPLTLNVRPQIDLGVDLQARGVDENRYEVDLKLRVSAKAEDKTVFLMELLYAGLFQIENAADEVLQQILLIEAPHLMFPFARRIVADAVRDGGMPPLMIEPIDFHGLYLAKMAEAQQAASAPDTQVT